MKKERLNHHHHIIYSNGSTRHSPSPLYFLSLSARTQATLCALSASHHSLPTFTCISSSLFSSFWRRKCVFGLLFLFPPSLILRPFSNSFSSFLICVQTFLTVPPPPHFKLKAYTVASDKQIYRHCRIPQSRRLMESPH